MMFSEDDQAEDKDISGAIEELDESEVEEEEPVDPAADFDPFGGTESE